MRSWGARAAGPPFAFRGRRPQRKRVRERKGAMMDGMTTWQIATYAAAGIALAACAGMRAFLPLLVLGIAGRLGRFELAQGYGWLETTPALILFGVAVVAETLADKIPLVDHALDTVHLVIKPAVGTLVAAALFVNLSPLPAALLGLLVSVGVATGVGLA